MMLTTKGRYAVMASIDMAANGNFRPVSLHDISIRQNIAQNYLEQIFHSLKKSGIVQSVRGPGGGYKFTKDVREISIGDIIDAVGEHVEMKRCSFENKKTCLPNNLRCNSHFLWDGLTRTIRDYMNKVTIYDVMNSNMSIELDFANDANQINCKISK